MADDQGWQGGRLLLRDCLEGLFRLSLHSSESWNLIAFSAAVKG